jgi:nicotinamidase-related amidase
MKTIYGLEIPATLEDICNRRSMALLVYDMQIGIVRQIADGQQTIAKLKEALDAARAAGMRIIFTRHLSLPKEMMGAMQYRMAMAWQHVETPEDVCPWFLRDSPDFPIVPDLTPLQSEAIFDKITMSAFEGTPLVIALRDCGIKTIAIAGIALEVGIEPTARHAADLGFIPVLLADACGAGHKDAARRSLEGLKFSGDAMFSDVNTFCTLLR